jgi:hypothetical protein
VAEGKLQGIAAIRGRWEATLSQIVEQPLPGVRRALVIAGSDRRGTAYGLMRVSQSIGVSPWYWWADVPVPHRETLAVSLASSQVDMPGVRYRGIFINDEDWGLIPWVKDTFDPQRSNIGPRTYEKVFELMLRLRLNYLWPAMHEVSTEFGAVPENVTLADRYAIVAGSSHCEPMLANNVHWDERTRGRWDYTINRDAIHSYWEENVRARANEEAVWTLGIRGIHDRPMEGPMDIPMRVNTVTRVIAEQRSLLERYVTHQWGPVAQIFVPYKEVLAIYDAGLQVPPDVTLVWVDDNFGYLRRLSSPQERQRPGGSGVYWHISYYGGPHSYTWINTTPPALMWEELHKAWENEARTVWVLNVGDIKPMEIGIDFFSRLAWDPQGMGPDSQPLFLHNLAAQIFGEHLAHPIAKLLEDFYRLGTLRKPELMNRQWALSLSPTDATQLTHDYEELLKRDKVIASAIPANASDAYTEMIGFPVRILALTGSVFMADRNVQQGIDRQANTLALEHFRDTLTEQVDRYNTRLAGGKWNGMMPGLVTGKDLTAWSSQVRWPWGEKTSSEAQVGIADTATATDPPTAPPAHQGWRDATRPDRQSHGTGPEWHRIDGLGPIGNAMALLPADQRSTWSSGDPLAPWIEFDFNTRGEQDLLVDFLPTFRLYPGAKLRVGISVDGHTPVPTEVPGSSGEEDERGTVRQSAVQDNFVRLRVPLPQLSPGKHTLRITAIDPGPVVERVLLP